MSFLLIIITAAIMTNSASATGTTKRIECPKCNSYVTFTNATGGEYDIAYFKAYYADGPVTVTFHGTGLNREDIEYRGLADINGGMWTEEPDFVTFNVKKQLSKNSEYFASGNYVTLTKPGLYEVNAEDTHKPHGGGEIGASDVGVKFYIYIGEKVSNSTTATLTKSRILVDGEECHYLAYNVEGSTCLSLWDIASMVFGTDAQFDLESTKDGDGLNIVTGKPYSGIYSNDESGVEDGEPADTAIATSIPRRFQINSAAAKLDVYDINQTSYYKLSALASIAGFKVTWNAAENAIEVDTGTASAMTMNLAPIASAADAGVIARPVTAAITVNDKSVTLEAFSINGNNYYKLRDLAYILNGTDKQFKLTCNDKTGTITLTPGRLYKHIGGELGFLGNGLEQKASLNQYAVSGANERITLTAYTICGSTYVPLKELAQLLDFGISWDSAALTVDINTNTTLSQNTAFNNSDGGGKLKLFINGDCMDWQNETPFINSEAGSTIYVPLEEIIKRIGGKYDLSYGTLWANVTLTDGTTVDVSVNDSHIYMNYGKNGWSSPLVSKTVDGKTVDAGLKPVYRSWEYYVPLSAISDFYKIPVAIEESGNDRLIYIGSKPAGTEPSLAGAPAPVIPDTTVWSPEKYLNSCVDWLTANAGFRKMSDVGAYFHPTVMDSFYALVSVGVTLNKTEIDGIDLTFRAWNSSGYAVSDTEDNLLVNYCDFSENIKLLCNCIFGEKDGKTVYDAIDDGFSSHGPGWSNWDKTLKIHGRTVELHCSGRGTLHVYIK